MDQWYDVIKKILDHGKSVQVVGQPDEIKPLEDAVGSKGMLIWCADVSKEQAEQVADYVA